MAKIPFATAYDTPKEKKATRSGSRIRAIYNYKIDSHGNKILEQTGEEDLQELINSYEEETKIENIMARVSMGDKSMLNPRTEFADMTKIANNLIDAKRQILMMENYWNSLPAEVKRLYDNNIDQFINDAGSEKWLDAMGLKNAAETVVVDNSTKKEPEPTSENN